MIQNALHILGPVSALHLDPFLLVDSQTKGFGGYVMICFNDGIVSGEYHVIFFDGDGPRECVRLTPEGRSFIGLDAAQSEFSARNKAHVTVHLYTIDFPPIGRLFSTVRNDPYLKIQVDRIRLRQIEKLACAYGSQEMLAERNDFTTKPPRMEFQPMFPGQPLPNFDMGFGRGGFLLYRCLEAKPFRNAMPVPDALPGVPEDARSSAHGTPSPTALEPQGENFQPNACPTPVSGILSPATESVQPFANPMPVPDALPGAPEDARSSAHGTPCPTTLASQPENFQPDACPTPVSGILSPATESGQPFANLKPVPEALPGAPEDARSSAHGTPCPTTPASQREHFQPNACPTPVSEILSPATESVQPFANLKPVRAALLRLAHVLQPSLHRTSVPAALPSELESVQPGGEIIPAVTSVDAPLDTLHPGSARTKRMRVSTSSPDQLELLPGPGVKDDVASPATMSRDGNEQAPEIVDLLQQLGNEFRKQCVSILGARGQVVFESCERQLREDIPAFRSDEMSSDTAVLVFDLIDAVVQSAPLFKRSKLRGVTLALLADLYNKHFDELNRYGFVARVEEIYFTHKK
jgi:hypothetical protein